MLKSIIALQIYVVVLNFIALIREQFSLNLVHYQLRIYVKCRKSDCINSKFISNFNFVF